MVRNYVLVLCFATPCVVCVSKEPATPMFRLDLCHSASISRVDFVLKMEPAHFSEMIVTTCGNI